MWQLSRDDLDTLAVGAALLGSGGGGEPYWFRALAVHAFGDRVQIPIHDVEDLPADMLAVSTGLVGSLLSFHERSPQGSEFTRAVLRVLREYPDASACVGNYESAGANIFAALVVAAAGTLPVVDCDGMGRALSWLDQTTYDVAGVSISPFVCTDSYGRTVLYEDIRGRTAEQFIRAATVEMGGWCAFAGYPMPIARLRTAGIPGTIRRAMELGRTVENTDARAVVDALVDDHGARRIATGRVADARWRRIRDGGIGSVVIRGADASVVRLEARNEFLLVLVDGEVAACTPEIICLMRTRDGRPLQAESVVAVGTEKLANGNEAVVSLRKLEAHLGKSADATVPMECGGLNSMIPLLVAARAGIPVVDADGMGRAFPELQMETFGVYGISGSPLVISDEKGHSVLVDTGDDNARMETFARAVTIQMGGASFIAEYPMSGADLKRTGIPGTLSLASGIGRAIREARAAHADPYLALMGAVQNSIYGYATSLLEGKVVDVERSIVGGFTAGRVTLAPFDEGELLTIDFRNENVVARRGERVVAIVPDLITVLDLESCTAITTEALRFGQRVRVVAISTPEIMRTPEALQVWGPQAFGVDHPWVPVEELSAGIADARHVIHR